MDFVREKFNSSVFHHFLLYKAIRFAGISPFFDILVLQLLGTLFGFTFSFISFSSDAFTLPANSTLFFFFVSFLVSLEMPMATMAFWRNKEMTFEEEEEEEEEEEFTGKVKIVEENFLLQLLAFLLVFLFSEENLLGK